MNIKRKCGAESIWVEVLEDLEADIQILHTRKILLLNAKIPTR